LVSIPIHWNDGLVQKSLVELILPIFWPPPLSRLGAVAGYFAVLAEPTRLKIMHTLCTDERLAQAAELLAKFG
jgi:hypothetical protein